MFNTDGQRKKPLKSTTDQALVCLHVDMVTTESERIWVLPIATTNESWITKRNAVRRGAYQSNLMFYGPGCLCISLPHYGDALAEGGEYAAWITGRCSGPAALDSLSVITMYHNRSDTYNNADPQMNIRDENFWAGIRELQRPKTT